MTRGIVEILIEAAGVQTIVGTDTEGGYKVYPTRAPENTKGPYVIVSEVSLNPSLAKGCPGYLDTMRFNVMACSINFAQSEILQAACRSVLDVGTGFSTDAGTFDSIYMVDRQDLFGATPGQDAGMFVKLGVYECMAW